MEGGCGRNTQEQTGLQCARGLGKALGLTCTSDAVAGRQGP